VEFVAIVSLAAFHFFFFSRRILYLDIAGPDEARAAFAPRRDLMFPFGLFPLPLPNLSASPHFDASG